MASRWVFFFLAVVVGVLGGLLLGWIVFPSNTTSALPEALRIDYRTDYMLMVAETYQKEGDINQAVLRLQFLGNELPQEMIQQALVFAEPRYTDADILLLRTLLQSLPAPEPGGQDGNP
jgi:hypothetical protein